MILKEFNVDKLSSLIAVHVDYITCIECCKYYSVPTTAICGHTLCHSCWRARQTCPSCGLHAEKKALKLNLPLQKHKDNICNLIHTFEELFNVKYDILLNLAVDKKPEDPDKNVKAWLTNSENHFSAPGTESQHSPTIHSTEASQVQCVEHISSNIQIHSEKKSINIPLESVHSVQQQYDWDKIDELPEIENDCELNTKSQAGPTDMEPFTFLMKENLVSSFSPRRSSRNKENVLNCNKSSDKSSVKISNTDPDNKGGKITKNWNNVKRMKKEFSKLNKNNRNKLNISIEMCKKSQMAKKNKLILPSSPHILYDIQDCTPGNSNIDQQNVAEGENVVEKEGVQKNDIAFSQSTPKQTANVLKADTTKNCAVSDFVKKSDHKMESSKNNCHAEKTFKGVEPAKVFFFKKGPLNTCNTSTGETNGTYKQKEPNNILCTNNDDIEIVIKIGDTITNICIKKKENDVQLKTNSDREIQTSSNKVNIDNKNLSHFTKLNNNLQNKHSDTAEKSNIQVTENNVNINLSSTTPKLQNVDKTTPSKKNTASAETTTIQFEITESIEKELANTENAHFGDQQKNSQSSYKSKTDDNITKVQHSCKKLDCISEDMEDENDIDIFDGENIKGDNIEPLKTSKNTPSAILMPSNKTKSQRAKRQGGKIDMSNLSSNKKRKTIQVEEGNESNHESHSKVQQDIQFDSESMNYDAIMSQVFANIDADMGKLVSDSNKTKLSQIYDTPGNSKDTQRLSTSNKRYEGNVKCSENIFSLSKCQDSEMFTPSNLKTYYENINDADEKPPDESEITQKNSKASKKNDKETYQKTDLDIIEISTPQQDDDSDKSVVEETPQKTQSFIRNKSKSDMLGSHEAITKKAKCTSNDAEAEGIISLSDTVDESTKRVENIIVVDTKRTTLETPLTIAKFVDQIKHKSTPVARKSLNFNTKEDDPEQTLCPVSFDAAKTTQEKEFLAKAFEQNHSPLQKQIKIKKFCIAGSCLTAPEQGNLKSLCSRRNWTYVDKYTKDLTHLVVGVDEENKSQRSVKYMCALAGSKWIVSYAWVVKCMETETAVDEEAFEALDGTGEPGPRRSRVSKQKLFQGITFYCMPPFSVLDVDTLKDILKSAGGRVADKPEEVRVMEHSKSSSLLLAEPEHTQDDMFLYLAIKLKVVPVNYEWVLNCLGSYTLSSIQELLLCPVTLLPKATEKWPTELMSRDYE